ncbi:MAG TPA: hypothetical protein VG479_09250 [Gaiellaceae bacterium]|nr:hypothetical protein [Gaiellaceae bacterium]
MLRPAGLEAELAEQGADRQAHDRRRERRVEERRHRVAEVGAPLSEDEQEAAVGDRCQDAEEDAERRVRPVGVASDDARDEDDAEKDDGHGRQGSRGGALAEERPGGERDEHDLDVAEDGREPGPDGGDRVVPEDEVGAEEQAADKAEDERAPVERPVSARLPPCEQRQRQERVCAAVERGSRRRNVGQPDEDRREGDAGRPGHGGENGPRSHGAER